MASHLKSLHWSMQLQNFAVGRHCCCKSHIVNFYNFSGAEDVIRSVDCCCDEQMEVLQRWIKVSRKQTQDFGATVERLKNQNPPKFSMQITFKERLPCTRYHARQWAWVDHPDHPFQFIESGYLEQQLAVIKNEQKRSFYQIDFLAGYI